MFNRRNQRNFNNRNNGSCYLGNSIAIIQKSVTVADISIVSYGNIKKEWNPSRIPLHKVRDLIPYKNYLTKLKNDDNYTKRLKKILFHSLLD